MDLNAFNSIESKEVFKWFNEINKIPRESGHEKEISDFLVKFAKERNLEVYQDRAMNVIIKKKGTNGYENKPAVIIQGHVDMVCEKTKDSNHDFRKDPIEMIVEGDILRANNTTLGGDDGIAIAMGMALLDSKDLPHPPIELLATTAEETGMDGAIAITGEHIDGKTMINIDGEEEGIFLVSCAGGMNTLIDFDIKREKTEGDALKIEVSGLKGGHSGIEIIKQRANAIKLLGRLLYAVRDDAVISHIEGGAKHNAIAKHAEALVVVKDINKVKKTLEEVAKNLKNEYRVEDPDMVINVSEASDVKDAFSKELSDKVIMLLTL